MMLLSVLRRSWQLGMVGRILGCIRLRGVSYGLELGAILANYVCLVLFVTLTCLDLVMLSSAVRTRVSLFRVWAMVSIGLIRVLNLRRGLGRVARSLAVMVIVVGTFRLDEMLRI